jgi:hypothetical protein
MVGWTRSGTFFSCLLSLHFAHLKIRLQCQRWTGNSSNNGLFQCHHSLHSGDFDGFFGYVFPATPLHLHFFQTAHSPQKQASVPTTGWQQFQQNGCSQAQILPLNKIDGFFWVCCLCHSSFSLPCVSLTTPSALLQS